MRLPRLTKLAIAVSLSAAAIPAAATAAPDSAPGSWSGTRPDNPVLSGRVPAAEQALDAIEAAFEDSTGDGAGNGGSPRAGVGSHELTQELVRLRLGFDELSAADQRTAAQYLARPTDGSEYYGANYSRDARPTNDCRKAPTAGSNVCVHWARSTVDAPPPGDRDGDGLPDQVETTRDTMNLVWGRIVDEGGYKAPLEDTKGPDTKLDIYLVDLGNDGLYGYCGPEGVGQGRAETAYCVLDDDYAERQFPANSPLGNLRVTGAHEFFHAVQFAYDVREDPWMMENTATWIEDEIFDNVNDNRYYLTRSSLRSPKRPLDSSNGLYVYGNWIWWRYLTERFPQENGTGLPTLVRDVWVRADDSAAGGTYSMSALSSELTERGQRLAYVFADFSGQNRLPDDPTTGIYEEGAAYQKAPLSARYALDADDRPSVGKQSQTLPHLSSTTVAFVPKSGYDGLGRVLRVDVDLPSTVHEPAALVTTFGTDDSVDRRFVRLSSTGNGSLDASFDSLTVERVELTLTNGDHSYDCNEGTGWSCRGVPDQKRSFTYSATSESGS